jgi:hypothetical protein
MATSKRVKRYVRCWNWDELGGRSRTQRRVSTAGWLLPPRVLHAREEASNSRPSEISSLV